MLFKTTDRAWNLANLYQSSRNRSLSAHHGLKCKSGKTVCLPSFAFLSMCWNLKTYSTLPQMTSSLPYVMGAYTIVVPDCWLINGGPSVRDLGDGYESWVIVYFSVTLQRLLFPVAVWPFIQFSTWNYSIQLRKEVYQQVSKPARVSTTMLYHVST